MRRVRVVELYAGVGQSTAPFRSWKKASIDLLVDLNEHARATYLHNFPNANYLQADLARVTSHALLTQLSRSPDVVVGCPPCQGFSESGKREIADPRNDHVRHFIRLALGLKPKVIALENVPMAALSPQFGAAIDQLEKAGYLWTAGVLNAALYGSAQCRQRVILVASNVGMPELPAPTHLPVGKYFDYCESALRRYSKSDDVLLGTTSSTFRANEALHPLFFGGPARLTTPTVGDLVSGLPDVDSHAGWALDHESWAHNNKILRVMAKVAEGCQRNTRRTYFASAYARLHRRGLARTVTTYFPNAGSGRFWHPTENRAISLREAARIQGFADTFRFVGGNTDANRTLVGNALDSALATAKYRAVRRLLD